MLANPQAVAFVPIPRVARIGLIILILVYALGCGTGALLFGPGASVNLYLAASTLLYCAVLAFPLLNYNARSDGWLQPMMVHVVLFGVIRNLPRAAPLYIFGLQEHAALPLDPTELTHLVAYENILTALSLACMYVGYHLGRNVPLPPLSFPKPKNLGAALAVGALVSCTALLLYIRLSGSFFQHLRNIGLNATAKEFVTDVDGVGLYITAAQWLATFLNIFLATEIRRRREGLQRFRFWVFWLVAFAFANALVYLAMGKRAGLIVNCAIACFIYIQNEGKVRWVRLAVVAALLLSVMGVIQTLRTTAPNARSFDDFSAALESRNESSAANFFEETAYRRGGYSSAYPIFHYVPSQSPLLWGETYLVILGRPIPRSLWPDKPRGTDFRAGAVFFGAAWGIPPGSVAEAYWNFHIPGVVVVFLAFGAFLRWLAKLYVENRHSGLVMVFYAYTVTSIGPSENAITNWFQTLIPLLVFAVVTGCVKPRRAA